MGTIEMSRSLSAYRAEASLCTRCHESGLLHIQADGRRARPLFHDDATGSSRIVFVFEAPNLADTYDADKGRMTCDPDTDPTGRFIYELLMHVGLRPADAVFTNAVLCLPAARSGKFPVLPAQRQACMPWLERLILDLDPLVVVACGAQALQALGCIQRHDRTLKSHAGSLTDWYGRKLLPLYHPSALGRISRSARHQLADIEALLPYLSSSTSDGAV